MTRRIRSTFPVVAIILVSGCTMGADTGQPQGESIDEGERDIAAYAGAPYLGELANTVLRDDVWGRPGLSQRDRSMITVAVLQARMETEALREHIGRALDNGLSQAELAEIITHATFYSGWPTGVNASKVAASVYRERGLPPVEVGPAALPVTASQFPNNVFPASLPLGELMNRVLYDDVWERPGLSKRDRSMVTVAVLQALYFDELRGHISRGLNNGVTPEEFSELIVQVVFYAGWPGGVLAAGYTRDLLVARGELVLPTR